ncbi:sulfotransferase family protein [Marinibacterium sp. SX1]|uniref:sulfotransferase family protein n=1 Tax=Marinibacterium sp. SX1 TaxID=3388424 RepID=UPI003D162F99
MKPFLDAPPRSPDFLCIGAQKSGTTWLHANLTHHPRIWMPPVKELQYFNQVHIPAHRSWTQEHRDSHAMRSLSSYVRNNDPLNLHYVRLLTLITMRGVDDDWYREIFAAAGSKIAGEMTPEYSLLDDTGIAHILGLAPDARFIFMMRDPIERCWSHVRMIHHRTPPCGIPLEELALLDDICDRADYPAILDRWRRHVPGDRLLTLFMDDVARRPLDLLRETIGFLGLDFDPALFPQAQKKVHEGEALDIPDGIYERMKERFRPVYDRLADEFPDVAVSWRARHF